MDETRNYFLKETEQNELINKNHKKLCTTLSYIKYFFLASTTTGCISTSAFASLLGISIGITIPAMALKIYAIAAEIKKYNSIIKKRKRSMIK